MGDECGANAMVLVAWFEIQCANFKITQVFIYHERDAGKIWNVGDVGWKVLID